MYSRASTTKLRDAETQRGASNARSAALNEIRQQAQRALQQGKISPAQYNQIVSNISRETRGHALANALLAQ